MTLIINSWTFQFLVQVQQVRSLLSMMRVKATGTEVLSIEFPRDTQRLVDTATIL